MLSDPFRMNKFRSDTQTAHPLDSDGAIFQSSGFRGDRAVFLLLRLFVCLAVLGASALAALAVMHVFLAYPQADDLYRATLLRSESISGMVWSFYLHWNSRWVAMLVEHAVSSDRTLWPMYPWMLLASMVMLYASCCCGFAVVTGLRPVGRAALAGGIVLFALLWLTIPYGEALYWLTGAVEHAVPTSLFVMLVYVIANVQTKIGTLIAAIMAFLLPCFHELFGVWTTGGLAVLVAIAFWTRQSDARRYIILLASAVVGTATVIFAPGNYSRLLVSHGMSFGDALIAASQQMWLLAPSWDVLLPAWLAAMLAAYQKTDPPSWYQAAPLISQAALLVAALGVPFVAIFLAVYAQGDVPARVYDEAYMLSFASAAALAATCGFALREWSPTRAVLTRSGSSVILVGLILICLVQAATAPRFRAAVYNFPNAVENKRLIFERAKQFQRDREAGVSDVRVDYRLASLTILPTWLDISEDPTDYRNRHMAMYFGLKSVRLSSYGPETGR